MAEPVEPTYASAYIPVSDELLADHPGQFAGVVRGILDGTWTPPPPPPEPPTPAGHLALVDALHHDRVLRAVVELHAPHWAHWRFRCEGCDMNGYEAEEPDWPCSTVGLIADELNIAIRAEH